MRRHERNWLLRPAARDPSTPEVRVSRRVARNKGRPNRGGTGHIHDEKRRQTWRVSESMALDIFGFHSENIDLES